MVQLAGDTTGHAFECEKYQTETVSQKLEKEGDNVWGTMKKGKQDHHIVALRLSPIDAKASNQSVSLRRGHNRRLTRTVTH
jgi:hypothetical protein